LKDEEVVRVVAAAVRGIEGFDLELRTIRKINSGSKIWKVLCSTGEFDTEFTLYVFSDASPEDLSDMTRERLSLHLPRWQATQTV